MDRRKTTPEGASSFRTLYIHRGSPRGLVEEVEGLSRFASQRWDKADRLKKEECSFERALETPLERARKAEKLADEIAAELRKLHDLKDQGQV